MNVFTEKEQGIINQAIEIMDSKLKSTQDIYNHPFLVKTFLRLQLEKCKREHLSVMYLCTQLRLIEYRVVFSGAVNYCTFDAREIVKDALELNATAIIIAHNHPSGDSEPSDADISSTIQTKKVLDLLNIRLVDHFVVGKGEITSLVETGRI